MVGCAFSIKDVLIAMRWAEQVRSRGYHVIITPKYLDADEVIEVYIPNATVPTFKVRHAGTSVLIKDCIGLTLSLPTLTDALLAVAPLTKPERRAMLKGASPAWLPAIPARPAQGARSVRSRTIGSVLHAAAIMFSPISRGV